HGVTNSTSELGMCSTLNRHVSNEVRHITHLELLGTSTHRLHTLIRRIGGLRIETLQTLKRSRRLNRTVVVRNDQNSITIKVSTRQTRGNLRIDTNSILCLLKNRVTFLVTFVDRQPRNLKDTTGWVSNEGNAVSSEERSCIALTVRIGVNTQAHLRLLTRKRSSTQAYSRGMHRISVVSKKLLLNFRLRETHDLLELST